jgi:hypothetical protein
MIWSMSAKDDEIGKPEVFLNQPVFPIQESGVRYWRVKIDSALRLLSRCSKSFAPKTAFTRELSLMVSTEEGIVPQDRESGSGWISTIGSWAIFFGSVSPKSHRCWCTAMASSSISVISNALRLNRISI